MSATRLNSIAIIILALAVIILAFGHAHAAPSPADLGLDKSAATGNLSVMDRSGTFVPLASVNSTAHTLTIPNASLVGIPNSSLANTGTTVGGSTCTLGAACSPSTTVGGTACALGGSCAPAVTVNGTTCTLGSTCAPTAVAVLTVGSSATSGGAAGQLMFDTGSVLSESATLVFTTPTLKLVSNTGALALGTSADTILTRDSANAFAQRNGTNAQLLSVYNTFTSATSYERAVFDWQHTANVLTIGEEIGSGGGSGRAIQFISGGSPIADIGITTAHWTFTGGGFNIPAGNPLTVAGTATFTGGVNTTGGTTSLGATTAGAMSVFSLSSSGVISAISGNITATSGSVVAGAAAATVITGQIAYGGTVTGNAACGTLASSAGCVVINIAGTNHFVPYY